MKDLRTWIAKRVAWKAWGRSVTVDGERYVPESVASALFDERQRLVSKLAKERKRRAAAQAAMAMPTKEYVSVMRRKTPNVGGEARLAAHRPSHTTTATPQGVASTDQLGRASEARN